ncbi:MAG: ATP-binding protein, partial [bacterium]|nr:ATP-binding protein [bacterium]
HPLNADFLHEQLMEYKMAERDAWWSTFLHYQHEAKDTVERIIEWAWSEYDKSHIKDDSVLLLATAMSWFLTTSNRFIRDKSTKALVALLQHRIKLLPKLLEKFKNVDDLYVRERLFAVAYGCVLRNSDDTESLKRLAKWVYDNIFKEGKPPVHILLRDYARGIIEVALRKGIELENIDESKINPPYESKWPQNMPSDEEIKKYEFDYRSKDFKDYYWSQNTIVSSMQPEHTTLKHSIYGDFGRYILQSALSHWDTGNITIQQLSNLAVKMIFEELGYNIELHGKFDIYVTKNYYYGRTEHKTERIGKKYQWIAFHKVSAMVSDHFPLKKEPWDYIQKHYKGPWHPYIRDIDPSLLIKNDDHLINSFSINNWLSSNGNYDAWRTEKETSEWLRTKNDLPDPIKILQVEDDNGEEWLVLEGLISWQEETPPEFEKYEIPIREFWYMIKSYIIKKADLTKIYEWAKEQNFWGRWMPESHELYKIFLGEYPCSIAFEDLRGDYNIWTKEAGGKEIPVPVIVTGDIYLNEFTTDCSSDGSISIKLPCKWLVNEMQLIHKFLDGRWYNDKEELVVIPTNIFADTSFSALLSKKQNLCEFLNKNEYTILWILLGEKRVLGGNLSHRNYEGHLLINGAYVLDHNDIVGSFNSEFEK